MPLFEDNLYGHIDKVQKAIDRLKAFEPLEGYYVAFSGGKDSQCVYHLCKMAGVKFDANYSVTSVDPPELIYFIKKHYPDVIWERHFWNDGKPHHYNPDGSPKPITMWGLIADHTIPPTRQVRYCCSVLKEAGGGGRVVVTGVRWAESNRRKLLHGLVDIRTESKELHKQAEQDPSYRKSKGGSINFMDDNDTGRQMVEQCYAKRKTTINPIVDWTDEEVWEFLNDVAKVPHCCLYDEGYTRLGCIGCPLQGRDGMLRDFERYPKYKELYIKAFDRMIANHPGEIKVADGTDAETAGGAMRYTQDGSHGTPDGTNAVHATADQEPFTDCLSRERERERERERGTSTVFQSNGGSQRQPQRTSDTGSTTAEATDRPRRADGKKVSPPPATQFSNNAERNFSFGGCGCTDRQKSGTSRTLPWGEISDVLAMEMQNKPERSESSSAWQEKQTAGGTIRTFNPDPKVADYESGAWLIENWPNWT